MAALFWWYAGLVVAYNRGGGGRFKTRLDYNETFSPINEINSCEGSFIPLRWWRHVLLCKPQKRHVFLVSFIKGYGELSFWLEIDKQINVLYSIYVSVLVCNYFRLSTLRLLFLCTTHCTPSHRLVRLTRGLHGTVKTLPVSHFDWQTAVFTLFPEDDTWASLSHQVNTWSFTSGLPWITTGAQILPRSTWHPLHLPVSGRWRKEALLGAMVNMYKNHFMGKYSTYFDVLLLNLAVIPPLTYASPYINERLTHRPPCTKNYEHSRGLILDKNDCLSYFGDHAVHSPTAEVHFAIASAGL